MTYSEIQKKTDAELTELVTAERDTLRAERFKDAFSRKGSVITAAKQTIARALTEQTARRRQINKQ